MDTWLLPVTETALLTAYERQELALSPPFALIKKGDAIVWIREKWLAGFAYVTHTGSCMSLDFYHILQSSERLAFTGDMTTYMPEGWDPLLDTPCDLHPGKGERLIRFITEQSTPSHLHYAHHLEEEILRANTVASRPSARPEPPLSVSPSTLTPHTRAQWCLRELARITGCDTWIARNDHHRQVGSGTLQDGCLVDFPPLPLDHSVMKRFKLIDTIWFQNGTPYVAFEAEFTSSIYSGLLRIGDLLAEMPATTFPIVIVAPEERKRKVFEEMNRPLFKRIGLTSACYFLSYENLLKLYGHVSDLSGHVSPSAILAYAEQP